MKFRTQRLFIVSIFILLMGALLACKARSETEDIANDAPFAEDALTEETAVAPAPTPFLRVNGRNIVDGNGRVIYLRGVNFDNSYWLEGATPLDYATESDVQLLNELGLNLIRVVLDWRYFETDLGFTLIDNYIQWSKTASVYLVLDMHIVPPDDELGDELIWQEMAAQQQFIDLWVTIATHYADEPIIVGYDLYNEPSPRDPGQWWDLVNRTVVAIRAADPSHILFVEKPLNNDQLEIIPDKNVVYSYHDYNPFIVTHAGAEWAADSPIPDNYSYPGRILEGVEWIDWSPDEAVLTEMTPDWIYWDSGLLTAPANVEFATVKLSVSGNVGHVWFDDLELLQNDEPQFVYNADIEEASITFEGDPANWSFWSEFETGDNAVIGAWSSEQARSGAHSIELSGFGNGFGIWSQSSGMLTAPLFPVSSGDTFQVKGWIYAPENKGSITLGLDYLNGIYVEYDSQRLRADIQPYLDWAEANNVPLFVGEFGAMTGSLNNARYVLLADKIHMMNEVDLHWALWTYRDTGGFGLYAYDEIDTRLAAILQQ
ncbi:MAG: cellulase family glycosylhydrolase [Ardenticatenaceae bacterium]|nr:cellulase family glycosylhydrolase [Ardenticatenaceae bacterium]